MLLLKGTIQEYDETVSLPLPVVAMLELFFTFSVPSSVRLLAVQAIQNVWPEFYATSAPWWSQWSYPEWPKHEAPLIGVAAATCDLDTFAWISEHVQLDMDAFCASHMRTPLHEALSQGSMDVIQYLLDDPWKFGFHMCNCWLRENEPCGLGDALCIACQSKSADKALAVLKVADVVHPGHVISAIHTMPREVVEILVKRAHFHLEEDIRTIWELLISFRRAELVDLMPGASETMFEKAVKENSLNVATALVSKDIVAPSEQMCFLVAQAGHAELLSLVLGKNREGISFKDGSQQGLLHAAAIFSDTVIGLEVLHVVQGHALRAGVALESINYEDNAKHTALHYAKGPVRDALRKLFPADDAWDRLAISSRDLTESNVVLGTGGATKTPVKEWLYFDPTYKVAVKRYPQQQMEKVKREFGVASLLHCKHLCRLLGWVELGVEVGIVWESHGPRASLYCRLRDWHLTVEVKAEWANHIRIALWYLHSRDPPLPHGDIDCRNVLISDSGDAVLCDFDWAWIPGWSTSQVSGLKLFPRFAQNAPLDLETKISQDYVLYGFLLMAVSF